MNTHPITNSGEQYSYPAVPANSAALASAAAAAAAAAQLRPQQCTGPIIVGATTSTTSTAAASIPRSAATSTATPTANSTAATVTSNISSNKFHPAGRYANASLSILGAYVAPYSERSNNKRPRVAECANVLERLVHPLFLCANKNYMNTNSFEQYGDDREDGKETNKIRGEGERGCGENAASDEEEYAVASSKVAYQAQLRAELERYKQKNLFIVKRRENVFKSLVQVHELYETGLDGIARMNDLRFVPDNVMPDKIPE